MDMPLWSDLFLIGNDAIDSSHRTMMSSLASLHAAVRNNDAALAGRMIDALADACSIHIQSEDETFFGSDHCFPHEMLDDLVATLRNGLRLGLAVEPVFDTISALGKALVSDIHADRWELARLAGSTAWADAGSRWPCPAGE